MWNDHAFNINWRELLEQVAAVVRTGGRLRGGTLDAECRQFLMPQSFLTVWSFRIQMGDVQTARQRIGRDYGLKP